MPAENVAPIAIRTIQSSRRPTLISLLGWLLVANGNCRGEPNPTGLCSVKLSGRTGLPCTVSVPNLIANRALLVTGQHGGVDVRRLMYQSLICRISWRQSRSDHPRGLTPALDAKLFERAADPLVDGVRADSQPRRNFLAAVVKVDQQKSFDLTRAKPGDWR